MGALDSLRFRVLKASSQIGDQLKFPSFCCARKSGAAISAKLATNRR